MEIEADAAPLVLRDLKQLGFEAAAVFEASLQLLVRGFERGGAALDPGFQILAGLPQLFLRFFAGTAGLRFAQFALHSGDESRQPFLHDIIVGAFTHGGDGCIFLDMAGNNDKRNVEPGLL